MGAAASTAIGTLTRQQVATKTQSTREMLDFMFHYLMEDIHIRDFYRLSSPDECKRYILVLANRIHESFLSLDIVPSRTKTGKLYYRSVHDHVSPPTEAEKVERQTLCVVLAFFYVRIFQIFGALALTLVDDATSMPRVARGVARVFETGAGAAAAAGLRPAVGRIGDVPVPIRGRGVPRFAGGAAPPALGLFSFIPLRSPDRAPEEGPDGRKYYVLDTREYTMGLEAPTALLVRSSNTARLFIRLQRSVTLSGRKVNYAVVTLHVDAKAGGGYQAYFENSMELLGVAVSRLGDFKTTMGIATLEREGGRYATTLDGITYRGEEIGRMFDVYGERLEEFLRARADKRAGEETDAVYERRAAAAIGEAPGRTRPGLPAPLLADDKVPQGMRMSSLYYAMTVTRPLPTCVSRAIQLLTTMPSGGMGPALSSVCDRGFFVEDSNKLRAGVVRPGDSMETSPGEMALVQLFYDTVSKATRDSLEQSPGALQDYTTFMRLMATVYGSGSSGASTLKPSDIRDKAMQTVCSKLMAGREPGAIPLSNETAKSLVPYVQQLFRQQLTHAAAAGKILSKLFSVDARGGVRQLRLNPALLDGGFPALEKITAETRQLLTAYYARCEETYREGVKTLYKGEMVPAAAEAATAVAGAKPIAAAPAAGPIDFGRVKDTKRGDIGEALRRGAAPATPSVAPVPKPVAAAPNPTTLSEGATAALRMVKEAKAAKEAKRVSFAATP
jgi:hypothetical protein